MARLNLTLATIHEAPNGEIAITDFDRLIRVCAEDCAKRPGIDKPRKLMLQLDFAPDGGDILVGIATKHVLPPSPSSLTRGAIDRSGKLIFNPASTEEPEQGTLDEANQ